jgi:hypothetical protein
MAIGRKTGGRVKGSNDKLPAAQAFVNRIEGMLGKANDKSGELYGNLERMACRFITSDDTKVAFGVWSKLVEYKFGKPIQPVTGKDGEPIQLQVVTNATFPQP